MFTVRHSRPEDLPRIMEIYSYARKFMADHGNPRQWGATNWPPEQLIRKDIEENRSYVCVFRNDEKPEGAARGSDEDTAARHLRAAEDAAASSLNTTEKAVAGSPGTAGDTAKCSLSMTEDSAADFADRPGRIVGTFYYTYGSHAEPCYDAITEGSWAAPAVLGEEQGNTYGVVHRIAGDGSVPGIGSFCINWAFDRCGHLRMDTHEDNTVMQNLLKKLGFIRCGIIHVEEDDDPRLAYEKFEAAD